jgi:hypothetical protein
MPSFSDLPAMKVFCADILSVLDSITFVSALVSQSLTRPRDFADHERLDQRMCKLTAVSKFYSARSRRRREAHSIQHSKSSASFPRRLPGLPIVFVFSVLLLAPISRARTINENFAAPFQNGWQIFGNTNLFHSNPANQNLEVTWDSRESNSFFYFPLGTTLGRSDDFTIEFDLRLNDIVSGIEPGKTTGLEIGFGFFNFATATNSSFSRGAFGGAPGLVEFDYFPKGYYEFGGMTYEVDATTTPTFISTNSFDYAPTIFAPYIQELPTNVVAHVQMNFTASNQTLVTLVTTNGAPLFQPPDVVLTDTNVSAFTASDDYRVDTFSINSYSSAGDDFDSVLGHGIVDNVRLSYPMPVENFTGGFVAGIWQVSFSSRPNWVYTLERTADFQSWAAASSTVPGNGGVLLLQDSAPLPQRAFYRVRATR